ncbi:MAG: hypothetical protein QG616_47 [Pseudomonadota bacterium]|nr:hypothetical protein [Pseudomonadota bacterium]MDQ5916422.1 hypothetical protein [Pseudomonadota bacterium]
MNSMNAPKILPWIAKRAGIDEAVALKLWRRAAGEAALLVGNHDSSDFFRCSVERFISLVEEEAGRCPLTGSNVTWMWRYQARMASLSLTAAESTYRLWRNNWEDFVSGQKKAA